MHNLTFRQLETIREVARCGSMVKAAQALHVTPAALTSRVKSLEEDLGLELFERFEGRLRLTEAGKEVVAAATRIDNVMSDLLSTLHGENGYLGGRLRIAFVITAKYFAPRLIAAFMKEHPQIDLRIYVGLSVPEMVPKRTIVISAERVPANEFAMLFLIEALPAVSDERCAPLLKLTYVLRKNSRPRHVAEG